MKITQQLRRSLTDAHSQIDMPPCMPALKRAEATEARAPERGRCRCLAECAGFRAQQAPPAPMLDSHRHAFCVECRCARARARSGVYAASAAIVFGVCRIFCVHLAGNVLTGEFN